MKKQFIAIVLMLVVGWLSGLEARAQAPVAGKDYVTVAGGKVPEGYEGKVLVEVYFSYLCHHCRDIQPQLSTWTAKLPSDVVVVYVPVEAMLKDRYGRRYRADHYVRAYYVGEHFGLTRQTHQKVYDMVQKGFLPGPADGPDIARIAMFFSVFGPTEAEVLEVMSSASVDEKVEQASQRTSDSGIRTMPTIVVDGSYSVSVKDANYAGMLETAGSLVDKARSRLGQ